MDCFDADVLIYAAVPDHPLGRRVLPLLNSPGGIGSVLLLPEVLGKPIRRGSIDEIRILAAVLGRLDLRPVDRATAELATAIVGRLRLHAADAAHLATAIKAGADRFVTNNRRDFPASITEVAITYPEDLPDVR
jgi:predicted nucleic acid-binding protein